MQIEKILFPVTSLGINSRVVIWTKGCLKMCPGCANPEAQYFDERNDRTVESIYNEIKQYDFQGVTISGGEPFLWAKELRKLITLILANHADDILIFTGYTLEELEKKNDEDINYILQHIAVIVDGPFVKEKYIANPLKGSENQRIIVLKKKYLSSYSEYIKQEKEVNIFYIDGEYHFIGIPSENYLDMMHEIIVGGGNSNG